ncbi:MAG: ATP-binding cassette domain-containing protein [Deltaproteobacteria bacterium]|nr:ATP-binding cassette domain-containing protein [Deltaproteobacteria bacterium]
MVRIEKVFKDLGEFSLKGVELVVEKGDYLMILGPTGAGKTILLETIAGIYRPDKGRIFIDETEITDLPPRKRGVGMVYQDYMLFPHLNVEKNIGFGLSSKSLKKDKKDSEKIHQIAEVLGIYHLLHRYPNTLSGGEQQRVAIARALVVGPELLLLDEPLSALDNNTKARLREELLRIHSLTKTTMIHVTHSFDEAFLLGSHMAIMNDGIIVQIGEPGEVFRKPNSRFVADFIGVSNLFQGEAICENGMSWVDVKGVRIVSSVQKEGHVYTSIRPEDILVSMKPLESSARNSFRGKIEKVVDCGSTVRIDVNTGIPFTVAMTRRSYQDLRLTKAKEVYLTFKATEVHIF